MFDVVYCCRYATEPEGLSTKEGSKSEVLLMSVRSKAGHIGSIVDNGKVQLAIPIFVV